MCLSPGLSRLFGPLVSFRGYEKMSPSSKICLGGVYHHRPKKGRSLHQKYYELGRYHSVLCYVEGVYHSVWHYAEVRQLHQIRPLQGPVSVNTNTKHHYRLEKQFDRLCHVQRPCGRVQVASLIYYRLEPGVWLQHIYTPCHRICSLFASDFYFSRAISTLNV